MCVYDNAILDISSIDVNEYMIRISIHSDLTFTYASWEHFAQCCTSFSRAVTMDENEKNALYDTNMYLEKIARFRSLSLGAFPRVFCSVSWIFQCATDIIEDLFCLASAKNTWVIFYVSMLWIIACWVLTLWWFFCGNIVLFWRDCDEICVIFLKMFFVRKCWLVFFWRVTNFFFVWLRNYPAILLCHKHVWDIVTWRY